MKACEKLMVLSFPFHVLLFAIAEKESWIQHIKNIRTAIKVLFHPVKVLFCKSLAFLIGNHKICGFKELCHRSWAPLTEEKIYISIFIYKG